MSGYFDLRSDLFRRAFASALTYPAYLAAGTERERAVWAGAEAALPALAPETQSRLDASGRLLNILCLSGLWCGDCVRSVPILARLAAAAGPSVKLRLLDRDAMPAVRDELRILGAKRVPVVVFLTEDFHEVGRFGDRTISTYRQKAAAELGAACPLPGSAGREALGVETEEWADVLERMLLMARLAPPLRARHAD